MRRPDGGANFKGWHSPLPDAVFSRKVRNGGADWERAEAAAAATVSQHEVVWCLS